MKTSLKIATFLFLLLSVVLTGCKSSEDTTATPSPETLSVEAMRAEVAAFELWNSYAGRAASPSSVELSPRVTAKVDEVHFHDGSMIKEGQLLFTLKKSDFIHQLAAHDANLARDSYRLDQLKKELAQAEKLWAKRVISKNELERLESAVLIAKSEVSAASARRELAAQNLSDTEIRSPVNARIGKALLTKGNLAVANDSILATLVSVDPIYVYFDSDIQYSLDLDAKDPLLTRISFNGLEIEGLLDYANNTFSEHTGTLQYRAIFSNQDGSLRPGQFIEIGIRADRSRKAIIVPENVVLTDQHRRYVWVLDEESQAQRRYVTTGQRSEKVCLYLQA
jgi:membrane fusion protein, multidrug efflux system